MKRQANQKWLDKVRQTDQRKYHLVRQVRHKTIFKVRQCLTIKIEKCCFIIYKQINSLQVNIKAVPNK
jgi:hypothetical protein